jgi:anti-anti-sigma factor
MADRLETTHGRFGCAIREGRVSAWVELEGELDAAAALEVERAICEATAGKLEVVLDLRRLRSIDDAGLRLVGRIDALVARTHGKLFVLHAPPGVRRLLSSVGIGERISAAAGP